ncbi:MAG TPA: aminotransferase class III-fold pyridoxal phosphate-dependent enzyme, partial [Aeromicrobium sp.]|nr:aminotransferase class III-fold pyridoxal phosphate-dependent enzyme [Aeromicrobium sp.]
IEPVLQGAGGMHIYPPAAVRWLAEQARDRGWLLVLDEIATGFHRIGLRQAFAFQRAQVKPDILCLGKALTAGYLTLAATLCSQDVADGISASESGVLMHGPTYMANPLACAVANASLDLLDAYDPTVTWEGAEARLREGLAPALEVPGVRDVRVIGSVGVIQLEQPVDVQAATSAAMDAGVWLRPFRDLIYAMPPYVCETADLEQIADGMVAAAKANHR